MMAYVRRLLGRSRREPTITSDAERAEIERRLADQRQRIEFLQSVAEVQERRIE